MLDGPEVERRLTDRLETHAVLYRDQPPQVIAILDEAALRRQVGDRKVMGEQIAHLVRLVTEHPRVRLHLVPRSAGEYPGLAGGSCMATLPEGVELGCVGGQVRTQEFSEAGVLTRMREVWEATLGEALPPRESIELVREVAEAWS